jgi:phosphatidylinositol phospholipase C delta
LITIHAGKPKGNIRDHLKIAGDVKRLSLSEQELERASASYGADIVRYLANSQS